MNFKLKTGSKNFGCKAWSTTTRQTSARGGVVKTTLHKEAMFATKQTKIFQTVAGGL